MLWCHHFDALLFYNDYNDCDGDHDYNDRYDHNDACDPRQLPRLVTPKYGGLVKTRVLQMVEKRLQSLGRNFQLVFVFDFTEPILVVCFPISYL